VVARRNLFAVGSKRNKIMLIGDGKGKAIPVTGREGP
jgi:hypothetical protein